MLLVGRVGLDRDFRTAQRLDPVGKRLGMHFRLVGMLFAQPIAQQPPDAGPDQPVRQATALGEIRRVHPRSTSTACGSGFTRLRSSPAWRNSRPTINAHTGPTQATTSHDGASHVTAPNPAATL